MGDKRFHFETKPGRESDPRWVVVFGILLTGLVILVACFSLVMSVCCR